MHEEGMHVKFFTDRKSGSKKFKWCIYECTDAKVNYE